VITVVEIKEMPYDERYSSILGYTKLLEDFVLPLVEKELGAQKVAELKKIWQNYEKAIPISASDEEKYDTAYGNWVRKWASAYNFVSDNMVESGIEEFKHEDVEALKRKNSSPSLLLLKLMRIISPKTAFRTFAKQMSYQLQVFTPFSVPELSGDKLVIHTTHCKILDYPSSEVACLVGCQNIYPIWLKDQFKVNMTTNRQGKSCTVTITPI
jgi:hypothetical protein